LLESRLAANGANLHRAGDYHTKLVAKLDRA